MFGELLSEVIRAGPDQAFGNEYVVVIGADQDVCLPGSVECFPCGVSFEKPIEGNQQDGSKMLFLHGLEDCGASLEDRNHRADHVQNLVVIL